MPKRWLFWKVCWLWFGLGVSQSVDVTFDSKDRGYFLKPLFESSDLTQPNVLEKPFVVNQPVGLGTLKASYGPFTADEAISSTLLQAILVNQTNSVNNVLVTDLDISAHLVSRSITKDRPLLQVLFHASQLGKDAKPRRTAKPGKIDQKWCLQMHAQKGEQELTAVCVLSNKDNVCIAEVTLPADWWQPKQTQSVDVLYSVYGINENLQCSSASNSIVPGKTSPVPQPKTHTKSFVSTVTLTHGQLTYREIKEDHHILVYVPQRSFYPGIKFRVPVKLEAESDLQLFVIRVKARHGLRIVGAEATNPSKWRITMDLSHKQKGAMVTASVQNRETYSKTDRTQPVFDWIFEVEDGATGEDPGRIMMNLEYEMNSQKEEKYGSIKNRIIARVPIQKDDTYTIVPVIKTTEVLNMAILTGKPLVFPMKVYSISQAGRVVDSTLQTTCHSGDEEVLKVAQSCNQVYLDGTEIRGSASVSVIAKYGRHTKFLFFRVWVPETPLDMYLSDNKLNQIKGWKAPRHHNRKTRGVDFGLLTHPGLMLRDEAERKEEFSTSCHLRFQQSIVEVYARFYIPDGMRKQYFFGRKVSLHVTDIVRTRLRVADTSIATLHGNVVGGLRPGRTEIQVLSRTGRVIGAKEIKVGNFKVHIERLEVNIVTDLSLTVEGAPEYPGTLLAKVHIKNKLHKKYQEGILDVVIQYSDGTKIPLSYISPSDYFLDMDTLNNHVVAFGPMLASDKPRIIALGQGKGELLKLSLELGDACQRKKSKALAVSYVYVDVDFSKDSTERLQNDGNVNLGNRANNKHYGVKNVQTELGILHVNMEENPKGQQHPIGKIPPPIEGDPEESKSPPKTVVEPVNEQSMKNPKAANKGHGKNPVKSIPIGIDLANLPQSDHRRDDEPSQEAQQQEVTRTQKLTSLEIVMYALLGVFCMAIIVFMVNCMVFVVKYRKKRVPHVVQESITKSHDWVWIGRATLERNSINTQCQQALMPEADFNGNHNNPQPSGQNSVRNSGSVGTGSGNGSNRNSVVSTYKGSECSIRITANPHPDANPSTSGQQPQGATAAPPVRHPGPHPPGINEFEWDYEAMGMSYDQLMEYFDNLKESTA